MLNLIDIQDVAHMTSAQGDEDVFVGVQDGRRFNLATVKATAKAKRSVVHGHGSNPMPITDLAADDVDISTLKDDVETVFKHILVGQRG